MTVTYVRRTTSDGRPLGLWHVAMPSAEPFGVRFDRLRARVGRPLARPSHRLGAPPGRRRATDPRGALHPHRSRPVAAERGGDDMSERRTAIMDNPEPTVIDRARHGQHDSSRETGDCFRASMSVLLDVPNGDHLPHGIDTEDWWVDWWRFLLNLGLTIAHDNAQGPIWKEQPWIASVRSLNYEGATHAIVMHRTHEVLFDPSPLQRYEGSLLGEDVVIGGTWLELADVSRINLLVAFRAEQNRQGVCCRG